MCAYISSLGMHLQLPAQHPTLQLTYRHDGSCVSAAPEGVPLFRCRRGQALFSLGSRMGCASDILAAYDDLKALMKPPQVFGAFRVLHGSRL
jgi:hypothetical protein